MNLDALRQSLRDSEAGVATFPQVIQTIVAAHCDGYYKDLAARTVTFYLADGSTHTESLSIPTPPIPDSFDEAALIASIRAAQRDEVRYPQFIVRAINAGAAAYRVFITGRRVLYLGRKGDIHVEHFPPAKP